ncbi:MAG TPA: glycosyltransferase family 2 protein [Candidatus Binatia bacterium]|nr:glycosyltransferase family 2 protein [Candidatus Binatia bacterium]
MAATLNSKPFSVASVTVAFNGAAQLPGHLDALRRQTLSLDEIVVVDNASQDGTVAMLSSNYPGVKLLRLGENTGVGGGFAAGIEYAAQKHDWIWLFDQDSRPASDCLEQLQEALTSDPEPSSIAVLAPVCVHPKNGMTYTGVSWRGGRLLPERTDPGKPITFVDSVISSGSLIRRDAILEAGLPRSDFFMDFVDHEHCLRLRRKGFRIGVVNRAILHHALGDSAKFNIFGWTKFWTDHAPWREYYMTRNHIFTVWNYYPQWRARSATTLRLARHAAGILIFGKEKLACLRAMHEGWIDGRAGKLGVRARTPDLSI